MRRPRRRVLVAATVAVVLLASGLWTGLEARSAYAHLSAAAGLVRRLEAQAAARDTAAARETLVRLRAETAAARAGTGDPGWRLGSRAPFVGADVMAVRTVAGVVDGLAHDALPALLDAVDTLGTGAVLPREGGVGLDALRAVAPGLATADASTREARQRLATVRTDELLPPVRSAVQELAEGLDRLASATGAASRAARLAPAMLGADGPRTYLLIFQNPAEIRAGGGMPGAYAVIRAERGRIAMTGQGSASSDLQVFLEPVLPLDPEARALYGDRLATYPANVTLTPHFPTSAALIREMYRRRSGVTVDGVVSVDPVALSYLLEATGPVPMPTGPALRADTVVRQLLADAYTGVSGTALADVRAKDRYFASAARAVFDTVVRGVAQPVAAVGGIARAAAEGRLLIWSARPDEQAILDGTAVQGVLPAADGARPTVGVFLNDATGAKLSYYLTGEAELTPVGCLVDGRMRLRLRVTLGSEAPEGGLPDYVLGLKLAGDPYTMRTQVLLFSPTGGGVDDVRVDGGPVAAGAGRERGRSVAVLMLDLAPGQRHTVEATLLTGAPPAGAPAARGVPVQPTVKVTPGARPWKITSEQGRSCGIPNS